MSIIQGSSVSASSTESGGFYNYPIEQSLRFDGSSYLSRTFGTPTDNNVYTYSCWFKLSALGSDMQFFSSRPTASPYTLFYYKNTGIIEFADSSVTGQYSWNHILRDTSSWYHLVLSVSASGTDRLKLYINSVLNSKSAGTDPNNNSTLLNSSVLHAIGSAQPITANYFNGYMANIHFIDGQSLSPYFFGELVGGVWTPKAFDGFASDGNTGSATNSYGTNGFRLTFAPDTVVSNQFQDQSPNSNHWDIN